MGYRSDIRVVCTQERFDKLVKQEMDKWKESEYRIFCHLDVEEHKNGYVLFGWNSIKWYTGCGESYKQETWFDDLFHNEKEGFNFCKMGDDMGDVEEIMNDWDIPYPVIIHGFDDYTTLEDFGK